MSLAENVHGDVMAREDVHPASSLPDAAFELLPRERMFAMVDELAEQWRTNTDPYPHVIVDDLFSPTLLRRLRDDYPARTEMKHWNTEHEDKYTSDGEKGLTAFTRCFLHQFNSGPFIEFIEKITGYEGLVADPVPGVHEVTRGGFLRIHVDHNHHPHTGLLRRLNLFVYLNEDWKPEYNGGLELWDEKCERCVTTVEPRFNRFVLFPVHEKAFHGHVAPINCPPNMSRRGVHVSYYSKERPGEEGGMVWRSAFTKTEPDNAVKDTMRAAKRWVPPALLDMMRRGPSGRP